jgi:hypothetical protein
VSIRTGQAAATLLDLPWPVWADLVDLLHPAPPPAPSKPVNDTGRIAAFFSR